MTRCRDETFYIKRAENDCSNAATHSGVDCFWWNDAHDLRRFVWAQSGFSICWFVKYSTEAMRWKWRTKVYCGMHFPVVECDEFSGFELIVLWPDGEQDNCKMHMKLNKSHVTGTHSKLNILYNRIDKQPLHMVRNRANVSRWNPIESEINSTISTKLART